MKFNKLFKTISSITLATLMVSAIMPINAIENTEPTKEEVLKDFNNLQVQIDSVLKNDGAKYIYNENEVIEVIDEYNFDFSSFNKFFDTNYTEESFTDTALNLIENAELEYHSEGRETCDIRGTYCHKNGTSSGWNYDRFYKDKRNSEKAALGLDELSRNWSLIGAGGGLASLIPGIGPAIVAGIGLGAGWNSWYASTLAAAIRSNNSDGDCGTVTDINKFTTVFSVWSQREFKV